MKVEKNIYRETAQIYDIIYGIDPPMPDVPFYLEYAKQQRGEILELGCGTGRVALALALEGFSVTGLDLSHQMLDIFKEKFAKAASEQPALADRVKIIHGNMAAFSLGRKFSLITAPFRAFQVLTVREDIENTLLCVREHLADDGIFIVNVFNPDRNPLDENWCEPEKFIDEIVDEPTGIRIKRYECRERIDPVNQIIYPYLAYDVTYPDGRGERLIEPLQMKYYYSRQLRALLENAGFAVIDEFSWYDKAPPQDGKEIIFVCRKK